MDGKKNKQIHFGGQRTKSKTKYSKWCEMKIIQQICSSMKCISANCCLTEHNRVVFQKRIAEQLLFSFLL